ncbi:MAG: hypothetical protein Q4G71_05490 [Pseudomonadota bacterium]|nr:hypothetical protein [Pseudomonadota bacterium]
MGAAVGVVASAVLGGGGGGLLGGMLGGGGLLGGIGQLVSGFLGGAGGAGGIGQVLQGFSPANIINATANLFNSVNGNSVKDAACTLHKEHGMPKFVQDIVNQAVDKILKQNHKETDPAAQKALDDATKGDADKTIQEMAQKIVDIVTKRLNEGVKGAGGEGGEGEAAAGSGRKKTAGSWLMLIAQAMGEVLGEKAAKMVELSQEVSAAAKEQKAAAQEMKDAKTEDQKKDAGASDKKAAARMTEAQTELQGVSQEYKLLTETISTVIKGIGESLSTMGRKQ